MTTGRLISSGLLLLLVLVTAGGLLLGLRREPLAPGSLDQKQTDRVAGHPSSPDPTPAPLRAFVGVVLSSESVDVTARIEGQIEDLRVRPGDRVEPGAVLAVLDTATLAAADLKIAELEVAAGEADLKRLRLQLDHAIARRTRVDALARRLMVSLQDVEDAIYQEEVAQAGLTSAEGSLAQKRAVVDQRRTLMKNARIIAPFGGVVSVNYVERGTTVNRGTPIVRIVEGNALKLRFAVPSVDGARLRRGMAVEAEIADMQARLSGVIDAISPEIDSASQMLFVYVTLPRERGRDPFAMQALVGRAARVTIPGLSR